MKKFNKVSVIVLVIVFMFSFSGSIVALAATTPSLGITGTYGVLSSTYTNTAAGTTISGDVGFTTGPAVAPGGTHANYGSSAPYSTAGTDQGNVLVNLNGQACTFTFANGAIDLATDTTHGPIGVYTPGVYCTTGAGAASIGTAGITLSGAGTYIFRINGALTTVDNSVVTLAGASAADVFWTPIAATTLGANTTFKGTVIDASGITIGSTVAWTGRALAFGGTVSTNADTITVPSIATLRVIKLVVNGTSGTAVSSDFTVHVKSAGVDVSGSPLAGTAAPGTAYALAAGTYVVSENGGQNVDASAYSQSFTGSCDSSGSVTLSASDDKTCTIVNTSVPLLVSPASVGGGSNRIVPVIGLLKVPSPLALPAGAGPVAYTYTAWNVGGPQALTSVTVTDDKCSPVTFLSGDLNGNSKLDPNEKWKYSCTATLSKTTTNTSIATGHSDDALKQAAIATAVATVVVGSPLTPPLINIAKVPSRLTPFPFGGGSGLYSYIVTNPGVVAMSNVVVTDDKCGPVSRVIGDGTANSNNNNGLLDPGESWAYT